MITTHKLLLEELNPKTGDWQDYDFAGVKALPLPYERGSYGTAFLDAQSLVAALNEAAKGKHSVINPVRFKGKGVYTNDEYDKLRAKQHAEKVNAWRKELLASLINVEKELPLPFERQQLIELIDSLRD